MKNKRNLKEERGITLLALIITIIILVILALITVNSAYMSGIIQFGVNGARDYAQSAIEENRIMEETGNYVESVTKKIKVLLGEEPPTLPELEGMDWFVKGVTEPAEESKEVADFYAKNQPNGTLIIYPKNGIKASVDYVSTGHGCGPASLPVWTKMVVLDQPEIGEQISSVYIAPGMGTNQCELLFHGLRNCTTIDLNELDTSHASYMAGMFDGCESLTSADLSRLDMRNVTDMSFMFYNCQNLKEVTISSFHTGLISSCYSMFDGCSMLRFLDLGGIDTSGSPDMSRMFSGCGKLNSSMTIMSEPQSINYMFKGCSTEERLIIYTKLYRGTRKCGTRYGSYC